MTALWSRFGVDRLSIKSRILGGFAIVLVLLVALAAMTVRGTLIVEVQSAHVEDSANVAALMGAFATSAEEARTRIVEYALSETDADLQIAQRGLVALREAGAQVSDRRGGDDRRRQSIADIAGQQGKYSAAVDEMIQAIGERRTRAADLAKAGTELRTILAAITTALAREKVTSETLEKGMRLMEAFHTSNTAIARFLASRNPADVGAANAELVAMRQALEAVKAGTGESRRTQRFVQATVEPIERFEQSLSGLVAATDRIKAAAATRETAGAALLQAVSAVRSQMLAEQRDAVGAMQAAVKSSRQAELAAAAGALAIGLVLAWLIGTGISRPISGITTSMRELAEGNLDRDIPHGQRRDEIGAMAHAVQSFRDGLRREKRLAAEQAAEQTAKEQRARTLTELNAGFETKIGRMVASLSAAAAAMNATARQMSTTADRTKERSVTVAGAAEEASSSVGTAAAAAEELASSIGEIGRQVAESAEVAAHAVAEAERTNTTVQALSADVNHIGEVVAMIQTIASQTNLLALNATIEAARAGKSGRGFAVVATEVKSLALQTGKATEEIGQKIANIQATTAGAVTAIQAIVTTIGRMNEIADAIATSIGQQSTATLEITRNVQEAASGTREVSSNIVAVSEAAGESGTAAQSVLASAAQLSHEAESLNTELDAYLTSLRAA